MLFGRLAKLNVWMASPVNCAQKLSRGILVDLTDAYAAFAMLCIAVIILAVSKQLWLFLTVVFNSWWENPFWLMTKGGRLVLAKAVLCNLSVT